MSMQRATCIWRPQGGLVVGAFVALAEPALYSRLGALMGMRLILVATTRSVKKRRSEERSDEESQSEILRFAQDDV